MKISGIIKVNNEQEIIQETLDHFSKFCNNGVYVYDDCSDDATLSILERHKNINGIYRNLRFDKDRYRHEWQSRQTALAMAQKHSPDWICCFDADERLDVDFDDLLYLMRSPNYDAIFMKLFDAYITHYDILNLFGSPGPPVISNYKERKYFGPEYREIGMFFRNTPYLKYHLPDQRIATFQGGYLSHGYVKHYGKAISIKQWEDTCTYYINNFPKYAEKWKARQGKAIHDKSDFGNDLITWDEKETKGVLLDV